MEQVEKMSTSQLIAEQQEDPEVSPIFLRSVSEIKVSQNSTCYCYEEWSATENVETTWCYRRREVDYLILDGCPRDQERTF